MSDQAARYREELGKEPPKLPDDDPLAWQWDPRLGVRVLRERLADDLGLPDEDEGPPPVIPGQESLL